jgi:hypothetical protein
MANTKITNPELFNLGDSTSATQLPVMTTTQRIAMVPTSSSPSLSIDYLVVAGGGAGGRDGGRGGGGGAGGLLTSIGQTPLTFSTGTQYVLTVGQGGLGSASVINNGDDSELNGSDITLITATGGGRGGGGPNTGGLNRSGSAGGSGGGAIAYYSGGNPGTGNTPATTPSQGNNGGDALNVNQYGAGGGGGAGAAGSNGSGNNGGTGGVGITNSITVASGTGPYYAGGGAGGGTGGNVSGGSGGGGSFNNSTAIGSSGTNGLGGGGAGGGMTGVPASGGSGVVILRYTTSDIDSYTTTGLTPTETIVGTDTVLSFTTVGTGTINFTGALIPGTPPMTDGEMIFNSDTDKVEYWDGTKWYGITYEVVLNPCYNYTDPVTPYINFNLTDPLGTNASNNVLNISPATYTGQITQTVAPTTDATLGYKYFDEPTWDNGLQLSATPSLGSYGTIIAWVKFDSVTSGTQRHSIFGEGDSGNTSKWMVFRYNHGTGKIQWSCNGSTANRTCDVNKTLSNNVWYQIAFVKNNNSTAQFYLNGVSAGTTLYSAGSTTEWFNNVSGNKWSWGSFQRGTYGVYDPMYAKSGSLKVFVDTALSASQILADYNYTKTCYGIS